MRMSLVLLVVGAQALHAQASAPRVIRGSITSEQGDAVPYASVTSDGTLLGMSNQEGRFNILLRHGEALELQFRRIGFRAESLSIGAGLDTTFTIRMKISEQSLARVMVEEERVRSLELNGFYQRMADRDKGISSSQFITPEEIRLRNASRVSQLFEGKAGVRVRRVCTAGVDNVIRGRNGMAPNVLSSNQRCMGLVGPTNCVITVYLDGVRLQPANPAKLRQTDGRVVDEETTVLIDDMISSASIVAAELHLRQASLPAKFQSEVGTCGVAILWTK
jgi:hypothetical protein